MDALLSVRIKTDAVYYYLLKGSIKSKMSSKKKVQERREFKEYLSITDKRVLDVKKSGIKLVANVEFSCLKMAPIIT